METKHKRDFIVQICWQPVAGSRECRESDLVASIGIAQYCRTVEGVAMGIVFLKHSVVVIGCEAPPIAHSFGVLYNVLTCSDKA